MTHTPHVDSTALAEAARRQGLEVMRAAGAVDVWSVPNGSIHLMGGTIMGDDSTQAVVDSY